jgi:hypothetical protein
MSGGYLADADRVMCVSKPRDRSSLKVGMTRGHLATLAVHGAALYDSIMMIGSAKGMLFERFVKTLKRPHRPWLSSCDAQSYRLIE